MNRPFLGTEAIAGGTLTRGRLRSRFEAVHPRVYTAKGTLLDLLSRIEAVWLWSARNGVIAGRAAAWLHGVPWVDADIPIEVIAARSRRHPGMLVRQERIAEDEIVEIGGMRVTSPARTAFDLARHLLQKEEAVAYLDAVAHATGCTQLDVLEIAERYPGARGIRRAKVALGLMDAGAQSPRETWLRLIVIDEGYPKPRTQIPVTDGNTTAYLDMGWDDKKIGLDYDGDYHFSDRRRYVSDIGRDEMVRRQKWIDLRVVAEHSRAYILHRLRDAWAERS